METLTAAEWYHLPEDEVVDLLEADTTSGLDALSVEDRRERFGSNVVTTRPGPGVLSRFLHQFHQPLIYILIVAGGIKALFGDWVSSGVIFGVVLVNAVVGFFQEEKATAAIAALAATLVADATVVRAGKRVVISATEVVPGDLVVLSAGGKVPADIRILSTRSLQIDESALTGESLPVEKAAPAVVALSTTLADRTNMAYASSLITRGEGMGVVTATGDHTEVGHISKLLGEVETLDTPLTQKMDRFSMIILRVIIVLAAITFAVGMLRGETTENMFSAAVALAVGAIPEGLPATVTITLAIGVSRMARRRAIIRKLPAVETLGSTTTICSDKTGTLTANQMTVQVVMAGGASHDVAGVGYHPAGDIQPRADQPENEGSGALALCLAAGVLCNDGELTGTGDEWAPIGDPTDVALVVAAMKGGIDVTAFRDRWQRLDVVPFDSRHRYMATLNHDPDTGVRTLSAKGAVESILERCVTMTNPSGESVPIDHAPITLAVEALASHGYRVLAMATRPIEATRQTIGHDDVTGLTFVGIQAMVDPARPEVEAAVAACRTAGIAVKMITGDHPLTAEAIAEQIGLVDSRPRAVTGAELAEMSDEDLAHAANASDVFARVSPEQKLRIVEALQAAGHVVAMTGDGVNDAPALRRADVGIAMGERGTEVAKEASDIVLTDDNFATIEAAVEEGRGVFDNLTKFIIWTLPTNLGEGLVIMVAVLVGTVLPILPIQILWINMTTAVVLGLTLAFEPKEDGIMIRPPRDPDRPIITATLLARIALVGTLLLAGAFGLFTYEMSLGSGEAAARTVAVGVFVVVQSFYLLNSRSFTSSMFRIGVFSNPAIWLGLGTMAILQALYTYLPIMNNLFGSTPIDATQWGRIFLVGFAVYLIIGVEKWMRQHFAKAPVVS
ncbi:MAG: HAD-IC family P-type ATPase [Actinomycetota bacterium]|nr:HAD-IC family P-type ATPase [Actinomycetota bacterium]